MKSTIAFIAFQAVLSGLTPLPAPAYAAVRSGIETPSPIDLWISRDSGGAPGDTQALSEMTVTLPGNVPLVLVRIPAGTFLMGSPVGERGRYDIEVLHEVTLTRDYYLGKTEVTQVQWEAVMGWAAPTSCGSVGGGVGPNYPVYCVTWDEIAGADGFIDRLNQYLGTALFRLPTEAEWERAARGGTTTRFSHGDVLECGDACEPCAAHDMAMAWCGNSVGGAYPVGSRNSNPFRLHDIHGNVAEWVQDWGADYEPGPQIDPEGPPTGTFRVIRDGSWASEARHTRSAMRGGTPPFLAYGGLGFRVARSVDPVSPPSWVALGDSFSSGEGAFQYLAGTADDDPPGVNTCHRADTAYSQVPYALGWTAQTFLSCSGAVTENLTPQALGGFPQCSQPLNPFEPCETFAAPDNLPQLDHPELAAAQFVTATIGGNDILFADLLKWCYRKPHCQEYTPPGWTMSLADYLPQLISILTPRFEQVLQQIRTAAPLADLRILGYPKVFPTDPASQNCQILTDPALYGAWMPDEQQWLNSLADLLNSAIAEAASNAGARFVAVDLPGLFPGHEVCGPSGSWFVPPPANGIMNWLDLFAAELFHPTPVGHRQGFRRALEADLVAAGLGMLAGGYIESEKSPSVGQEKIVTPIPTMGTLRIRVVDSMCGQVATGGGILSISGSGFAPFSQVAVELEATSQFSLASAVTDAAGAFSISVGVPIGVEADPLAQLQASGVGTDGQARLLLAYLKIGPELTVDQDLDGVPDACDNCPTTWNLSQANTDGDAPGDSCDSCPTDPLNDNDGDGLCADVDPCPSDPLNDGDGDGLCADDDNCPETANVLQEDSDGDTWGNACDSCPGLSDAICPFRDGFETGDSARWSLTTP